MSSIVTITFSPCIDKSINVASLIPEKKLQCSSPILQPGGGGINVARAIRKLGGNATAIYPVGGCTGKKLSQLLENEHIELLPVEAINETRENIILFETSTNRQFRLGVPPVSLSKTEYTKILTSLENIPSAKYIVVSGSLPKDAPSDLFSRVACIAKKKHARLIVDTSGDALKNALHEGVYLLKPNLSELCSLTGKETLSPSEIAPAGKRIIEQGHCEVIVVSMGRKGAIMITKNAVKYIVAPVVATRSTVGAGDSMVAGMVFMLSNGHSVEEAVRYGVSCGTAATMNPGTELCKKTDAEKLYALTQSYA